jgi:hypothetical protein
LSGGYHQRRQSVFGRFLIFLDQAMVRHFLSGSKQNDPNPRRMNVMLLNHSPRLVSHRATIPPQAVIRRIAPETEIQRIAGPSKTAIEDELAQAREVWRHYQLTRKRDAVYDYLSAVFKIVRRWCREDRAKTSSHQALKVIGQAHRIRKVEPFATVILCTSDLRAVDANTRNKWARALRYAKRCKPNAQGIAQFIKSRGGINDCADRSSGRLR